MIEGNLTGMKKNQLIALENINDLCLNMQEAVQVCLIFTELRLPITKTVDFCELLSIENR